jgi:hypothetical protein
MVILRLAEVFVSLGLFVFMFFLLSFEPTALFHRFRAFFYGETVLFVRDVSFFLHLEDENLVFLVWDELVVSLQFADFGLVFVFQFGDFPMFGVYLLLADHHEDDEHQQEEKEEVPRAHLLVHQYFAAEDVGKEVAEPGLFGFVVVSGLRGCFHG